jgi:hypothetical protein
MPATSVAREPLSEAASAPNAKPVSAEADRTG